MNQLVVEAQVVELSALRYTPAGTPAINAKLRHQSSQLEAGSQRQVQFEMNAVALGVLAEQLAQASLDSKWIFKGFLAAGRNGKSAVFHVQQLSTAQ